MHARRTTTLLALPLALSLTLAACGGEDEPEETTSAAAPTTPDVADTTPEAQTAAPVESTEAQATEAETTTEEEPTEEETTDAGSADGVPALADIWPVAIDNARASESVTATISGVQGGEELDATLSGQMDDSNFEVDITLDDASATVMADEGVYYVNGDEGFWEMSGAPDPAAFADQWIEAPADSGIGDQFTLSSLWEGFFQSVPTDAASLQTSSAELSDLDGVEAYHYVIDGEDAEIWVSADGEDNLLRVIIDEGSEEPMEIVATDWNDVDPHDPPADAVPVSELMGG